MWRVDRRGNRYFFFLAVFFLAVFFAVFLAFFAFFAMVSSERWLTKYAQAGNQHVRCRDYTTILKLIRRHVMMLLMT